MLTTNFIPIATQPESSNVAQNCYQWIQGFADVVKILAVFGGALTGGYFSHWLLIRRDVASRKREFVGFLKGWRSEIENFQMKQISGRNVDVIDEIFTPKLPQFHTIAAKVEGDAVDIVEFQRLVAGIAGFRYQNLKNNEDPRKAALAVINAMVHFCK